MLKLICLLLVVGVIGEVRSTPKKYDAETEGGFNPSHRYYESDLLSQRSYRNKTDYVPQNPIAQDKRDGEKESRFGTISYGTSGNGYGGNNGVNYGMMKLDIGGVALGALIGLGAILIIPKLAQVFAGAHSYRSNLEGEMSSITNILARIDHSLAENDIDTTSCTQRIICSFVNDAERNRKVGEATSLDDLVLSFTKNSMVSNVLDGTAIKEAVQVGQSQNADKCALTYSKCPLTKQSILSVIGSLLPIN